MNPPVNPSVNTFRNDSFLRALKGQATAYTPVWIMRQAGRYLPEYRAIRERAGDFLSLCRNPELACEVTLQPLERFRLDAAILFSDILTIPDAMGLGLSIDEGVGPRFERPLRTARDVDNLSAPDPEQDLRYVLDAARAAKGALGDSVPLIGFSGSPWTLATYMVEGGGGRDFRTLKRMLYTAPRLAHRLLEVNARAVADYLKAQIAAGVDAVMVFDTWGGALSARAFREFSLAYTERIVRELRADRGGVPILLFTKGGGQWAEAIAATGCDAVGLDWTASLSDVRKRLGDGVALQGNMDPLVLRSTPERIREEARAVLDDFGAYGRHVFNLGHGIPPDVDPGHVAALVDAVHEYSAR